MLTFFLIRQFEKLRGPLELSHAYEGCRTDMKEYFASSEFLNFCRDRKIPAIPHEPLLYSDLPHKAFLRP